MKLIYLHTCDRPSAKFDWTSYGPGETTHNRYAINFLTDGVCMLLDSMARAGLVDHIYAFIDSKFSCGSLNITNDFTLSVVPSMEEVPDYLEPGDILWVRGGFKQWLPILNRIRAARKNWILFYRANTNRGSWPFWDITMNDLIDTPRMINGRFHFPYSKPVNERLFRAIIPSDQTYDFMVGASHVHSKKGQFRALEALLGYKEKYDPEVKVCLPGGWLRSGHNSRMTEIHDNRLLDLDILGYQKRGCLAKSMNRSKFFIHAGPGGQNDRGVLEALRCGTPAIIKDPRRYSPFIGNNSAFVTVCNSPQISDWVEAINAAKIKAESFGDFNVYRREVAIWYDKHNGLFEVALPKMETLFSFLKRNPVPDNIQLMREFTYGRS